MQGTNRPARRLIRILHREGVSGLLFAVIIVVLAIVYGVLLSNSLVRAANLPVRNLTGGARSVHINGFDLWYREVGPADRNAPVLVVIHGGPGMSDHYFGTLLDRLKNRYRVVYYDQRGSGFSQIRPDR
ncbi:MAG TPA: alpha/beta fold hydrolase, partial [Spirochaetia bacterium]|nr:alpha/beta fold hydrolase [Spirochaetia bacterium]